MKRGHQSKQDNQPSAQSPVSPPAQRVAILLEMPADDPGLGLRGLRWLLKRAWRGYRLRCLALRDPVETKTFGQVETRFSNPSERDDEETDR
jgi:hypothetical protein